MVNPASTLMSSPPSYTQQSRSDALSRAGSIASAFNSGAFNVGGSSLTPVVMWAGIAFVAWKILPGLLKGSRRPGKRRKKK